MMRRRMKKQNGSVAMAGKTAGGIRVCLDLFSFFFVSRQKRKILVVYFLHYTLYLRNSLIITGTSVFVAHITQRF